MGSVPLSSPSPRSWVGSSPDSWAGSSPSSWASPSPGPSPDSWSSSGFRSETGIGTRLVSSCDFWLLARPEFCPNRATPADASRGNSGSPIFLCSSGKFAGIVYAQASDTINIIDETKQKVATIPYDAGLAACIPASAIRKFLERR